MVSNSSTAAMMLSHFANLVLGFRRESIVQRRLYRRAYSMEGGWLKSPKDDEVGLWMSVDDG
jgi:hypothetical protein